MGKKKNAKKKKYEDDEDFVPGRKKKKNPDDQPIVNEVKDIKVEMKDEVDATSNLIKDIEISEVDELPEDDDDFKVPESSISRMASELGDIDLYHPERKLTPLKKGKGKRKKQVTPMRP